MAEGLRLPPAGPRRKRLPPLQVHHWRLPSRSESGRSRGRGEPSLPRPEADARVWQPRVDRDQSVTSGGLGDCVSGGEPCTNAARRDINRRRNRVLAALIIRTSRRFAVSKDRPAFRRQLHGQGRSVPGRIRLDTTGVPPTLPAACRRRRRRAARQSRLAQPAALSLDVWPVSRCLDAVLPLVNVAADPNRSTSSRA
jgi:hypothetical protein